MDTRPIIIYDGDCPLCKRSVSWIKKRTTDGRYRYVEAQSPEGRQIQTQHSVDSLDEGTLILIANGRIYKRSDAALKIATGLKGAWKVIAVLRVVPRPLRDWLYNLIARNRRRWLKHS